MTYQDMIQYYFHTQLGILELIAAGLTILCVFQLTQQSIWNFLWGSIGVILYGYIFYSINLFADMTLQWGYFLPIQLYGWWYWYYKGDKVVDGRLQKDTLEVTTAEPIEWFGMFVLIAAGTLVAGYLYHNYTSAHYPYWDSYILVASIIAQFLLSKKFLENWILWISIDLIAIPLYYVKGLYVTSGLYCILLLLCIKGLIQWWASMQKAQVVQVKQ
jgi:nicotinamide mononucleotide transporter